MKFKLNGEEVEAEEQISIRSLLDKYTLDDRKIAVEKNLELIPKSSFSSEKISENDEVEIIHFIGGG